jgi:hypothetical protein
MPDEVSSKKSTEIQVASLPHRRDENFLSLYANSAGVASTFYNISIIFGEIDLQGSKEQAHIKDIVAVAMSWEHRKALLTNIQKIIQDYEHKNGPIRTNPG